MNRLASFDVFDTVLTRAVGAPESLFLLLGRKLASLSLIACTPEAFARARIQAEGRASKNVGAGHPSLERIYEELGASLGLTESRRTHLMSMELELEEELIRLVPHMAPQVRRARERGDRVVFVSDMYLPATFIQAQLARHGLWRPQDVCYVSCEWGAVKSNGLYRKVLEREGLKPRQVTHTGNHRDDRVVPQRLGMQIQPATDANPNRYERLLEAHAYETEGLTSVMAGASRLARLGTPVSSERERAIRDIAASVGGPALAAYVLWVLRRSSELGLRRLYFVSRDGHLLLEIAKRLQPKLGVHCELRYLFGGRQAWHVAGLSEVDDRQLERAFNVAGFCSIAMVLTRLGIRPVEVSEGLRACGFPPRSWNQHLHPKQQSRLLSCLLDVIEDERVRDLIRTRARESRERTISYLRQEGLFDPGPFALVDLGWSGRMIESLTQASGIQPVVFYVGFHGWKSAVGAPRRECWLFDKATQCGFVKAGNYAALPLEAFCQADHGTVLGYEERGGRMVPVMQDGRRNPLMMRWGHLIVRRTICQFAEELVLDASLVNARTDSRPAIAALLASFWKTPTKEEALAWADFPFEWDQSGTNWKPLAVRFGWNDVFRSLLEGHPAKRWPWQWSEGSLCISSSPIRIAARMAARAGNTLDRVVTKIVRRYGLGQAKRAFVGWLK